MLPVSVLDDPRLSGSKIRDACALACRDGHNLLWIESGCVDEQNLTEAGRTLASKYAWYCNAAVCYVYLPDVPHSEDPRVPGSAFRASQWFKKCGTLEDLVAPRVIKFLSQEWEAIGTKETLADVIEDITGVHRDVLTYRRPVSEVSFAEQISWGARRSTKRFEDRAYSLLGLLSITMTLRYGEGERAFRRLREKILQQNPRKPLFPPGHSINGSEAWCTLTTTMGVPPASECRLLNPPRSFLAPSPLAFIFSGDIYSFSPNADSRHHAIPDCPMAGPFLRREYTPSPYGTKTRFCLFPLPNSTVTVEDMEVAVGTGPRWYLALLACKRRSLQDSKPHVLARLCYALPDSTESSSVTLHVGELVREYDSSDCVLGAADWRWQSLISIPEQYLASNRLDPDMDVYIPYHHYSPCSCPSASRNLGTVTKISVYRWTKAMLHDQGYHIGSYSRWSNHKGSSHPLHTSDTISLYSMAFPHILDLTKDDQKAAILLPARAWHTSLQKSLGLVRDNEAGNIQPLSCIVVTPSDPTFEWLTTKSSRRGPLSDTLPTEARRRCASQCEWKIGGEIVRPSLTYLAANHYELRIDVVQE